MKAFDISFVEDYGLQGGRLSCAISDCPLDGEHPEWKRPAVVVVPGGAYQFCSKREGEPIASFFLSKGFQTFILTYQTCDDHAHYPEQLLELASAVDFIRKNADEYHVNPEEIFVVGFSAGGHLTANLAVDFVYASEQSKVPLDCRPTAVGLGYPVITTKAGYEDSHKNLLLNCSEAQKAEAMMRLQLDELVSEQTPPTFIWTTAEDALVSAENSLCFAMALARSKVSYELHIYPQGWHGLSACNLEICGAESFLRKNAQWMQDCADFFRLYTEEAF